jgi:hypothetical protein
MARKEGLRSSDEFHNQKLAIQAVEQKYSFGMTQIADIHEYAATQFDNTIRRILGIAKDQQRR